MIGIFDSGLGGLTILNALKKKLPDYHYVYLADSGRAPYGNKSKKIIYKYTRQAINFLFAKKCEIVILACNTASATSLRKIQRKYLPKYYPNKKVLGIVVPNIEVILKHLSKTKNKKPNIIGIMATKATIKSRSYQKEFNKIKTNTEVYSLSCPKLVPLIEKNKSDSSDLYESLGKYLKIFKKRKVQAIILACSHFPILKEKMNKLLENKINIIDTSDDIAGKTKQYLEKHSDIKRKLIKDKKIEFYTSGDVKNFKNMAKKILKQKINKVDFVNLKNH